MATLFFHSDQPVLTVGMVETLRKAGEMKLSGTFSATGELLRALVKSKPDLLLLDLTPDFTLEFLKSIQEAAGDTKLVLWVHFISTEMALQAMGMGVCGILRKTLSPEVLVNSLLMLNDGHRLFEKALTDSIQTTKRYTLTRREGQIVTLVAQGLKNRELGEALNISQGTVKVYLSRLFKKLDLKDRFELALFGLKNMSTAYGAQGVHKVARAAQAQNPRAFYVERQPIFGADAPLHRN